VSYAYVVLGLKKLKAEDFCLTIDSGRSNPVLLLAQLSAAKPWTLKACVW
jgi:hypothetical protein